MEKIYCEVRGKSFYDDEPCWYQQNKVENPIKCCVKCNFFKNLRKRNPVLNSFSLPITRGKGHLSPILKKKSKKDDMAIKRKRITKELPFDGAWGQDKLTYFVYPYAKKMEKTQKEAMEAFFLEIKNSSKSSIPSGLWITDNEMALLKEAEKGSLKAIQYLVKKNPCVLYLPFVIDKVMDVLLEYKNSRDRNRMAYIRNIEWPAFLPNRAGGRIDRPDKETLVWLMKAYMEREKIKKFEAASKVAEIYSISMERLYRMGSLGKKGRPRKT